MQNAAIPAGTRPAAAGKNNREKFEKTIPLTLCQPMRCKRPERIGNFEELQFQQPTPDRRIGTLNYFAKK
jgi:hypothetical protein